MSLFSIESRLPALTPTKSLGAGSRRQPEPGARGAVRAQVVGDLPFMSYQASLEQGLVNAGRDGYLWFLDRGPLKDNGGKVGFVGGMDIPLIRRFQCGYEQGIKYANPKVELIANMTGTTPAAWNDPTKGAELAQSQFDRGADVSHFRYFTNGDTRAALRDWLVEPEPRAALKAAAAANGAEVIGGMIVGRDPADYAREEFLPRLAALSV